MTKEMIKEIVSALIVSLVALLTLYLIYTTYFFSNADANTYQRASQILQVMIALMGTVTGYYFGRIPAEAHAAGMQQVATAAQHSAENAQSQLATTAEHAATSASAASNAIEDKNRVVNQVHTLRDRLATSPLGSGTQPPAEIDFAIKELDRIIEHATE